MITMRRAEEDEPRRASGGGNAPFSSNIMDEMSRQRGGQQPEGSFPRGMDDIVLRQQQLLRQEQYQGQQQQQRNDFGLPSQGQQLPMGAAGMPSLMEISRAEEILAAARDAITQNASGRSTGPGTQFGGGGNMPASDDFGASARPMMNQPEGRWASAYDPTSLRPPGPQMNAPISTTGGLGSHDMQLLLSKQNQGMSLATANASQSSSMAMRQAMMNQMPAENMGALESLLMRQEEERLLMGGKRQRSSSGGDESPRPKKYGGPNFPGGMDPQSFAPQAMGGASKTMMLPQGMEVPAGMYVKPRKRRAKTFPVKLQECLMANYDERYFAWLPDGRSFVIIHPEEFIDRVVSKTFKNSKYSSFVRKLNRWGFARLTSGTGTDCFYHPLFQRDRMDLASQMLCMPRNDSVSAKKRARLGIETPADRPVITAADVDPQDRPSLKGVEKYFGEAEGESPKAAAESESDEELAAPQDRKQAAVSSSAAERASSTEPRREGDHPEALS